MVVEVSVLVAFHSHTLDREKRMSGWDWLCVGAWAFTALFVSFLALFWGREVGAIGYWYWGSVAVLVWAFGGFLWAVLP